MTQFLRPLLVLLICGSLSAVGSGQTVRLGSVDRSEGCSGIFTDSGDVTGNHLSAGRSDTITLCPGASAPNTAIRLDFTGLAVDGLLTFFDGESVEADSLRQLGRINNGQTPSITATTQNASGCLTIVFSSAGEREGWVAEISCVAPCQRIEAEISRSDPDLLPEEFVRLCPRQPITLSATGRYPDNNTSYAQSDEEPDFLWRMGDGSVLRGQSVTYAYSQPGGYLATLEITDRRGCQSSNRAARRVGVLAAPEMSIEPTAPVTLCPGEEALISADPDRPAAISLGTVPRTLRFENSEDSVRRIDIPASSDELLSSTLRIDGFEPGQQITSVADLKSLCLDIEHSFIGDLTMWLECPEGNRLDLLRYAPTDPNTAGKQRFGFGDRDDTGPEEPERYCWAPDAGRTVDEQAAGMPAGGTTPPILPFDRSYLPLGDGFSNLIGCSLNGPWTLFVRDLSPSDDGTVYTFDLTFSDRLEGDRFRIAVTDSVTVLANDNTVASGSDRWLFSAADPGYYLIPLRGAPATNCPADSFVRIDVRSPFATGCAECGAAGDTTVEQTVCAGVPTPLEFPYDSPGSRSLRFLARENGTRPGTSLRSELSVATVRPNRFGQDIGELDRICVALSSAAALTDVRLTLVAPDGQRIVLAESGSLAGTTFSGCFGPEQLNSGPSLAGTSINGNWTLEADRPEAGAPLQLVEWSVAFEREPNETYSWSGGAGTLSCTDCASPELTTTEDTEYTLTVISDTGCERRATFLVTVDPLPGDIPARITPACRGSANGRIEPHSDLSPYALSWSNGSTGAVLNDLASGTYTLNLTTSSGCQRGFDFIVGEAPVPAVDIATEDVRCAAETNGSITLLPRGGRTYRYSWPDDLADSTEASVSELAAGSYRLTITDASGCGFDTLLRISAPDPLNVISDLNPPSCAGDSDGSIALSVSGGSGPFTFDWSDGETEANREQLAAGDYRLYLADTAGCSFDTLFNLPDPAPLSIDLAAVDPVCAGDDTGQITVAVSGGAGTYTYRIGERPEQDAPVAVNLGAGEYTVRVTDTNGCRITDSVVVAGGSFIAVDLGPDRSVAFGDSLLLTPEVSGDRFPLSYRWSSDISTLLPCTDCPEIQIIPQFSGLYRLTASDQLGCTASDEIRIRVTRDRRLGVPTAFSPNGDGVNDRLVIFGGARTQVRHLRIYGRWGGLIFSAGDFPAGDPTAGWDGTSVGGTPMPAGAYVYLVEVRFPDGFTDRTTGIIQLIR